MTATVFNVRNSPDALADNSNKIGQLIQDERVVVLGPVREWLFVSGVAIQDFVHGRFIDPPTAPAPRSMARAVDPQSRSVAWMAVVDAPAGLRLHQTPNPESSILALLPHQSQVQVIGEAGDWLQVQSEVGGGYVHGEYVLHPDQKAHIPADLVRAVLRTWIRFKPLLTEQAARLGIDPAVAVAVLLTESGGQATDKTIVKIKGVNAILVPDPYSVPVGDLFHRHQLFLSGQLHGSRCAKASYTARA
jgi:hypothetical protein